MGVWNAGQWSDTSGVQTVLLLAKLHCWWLSQDGVDLQF